QSLGGEDLEAIISDYAEDAILIVNNGIFRGRDGVRQVFTQLLSDVPQAQWELQTVFADNVLYLEWVARSTERAIEDGVDTFIFEDGLITVQTVRYTVTPA
ncbi:MAG TPA: nuclear transport factor 2 family protein, partial [Nocardioidaceae bacterium]|nr:nuclear transport factor 2 family protein [Nocardioidaceae bacterium]